MAVHGPDGQDAVWPPGLAATRRAPAFGSLEGLEMS